MCIRDRLTNAPTGATTFTDPNPTAGATYVIRNRPPGNNTFTDYPCTTTTAPAPAPAPEPAPEPEPAPPPPPAPAAVCTATVTANGVLLEWDLPGSNVIRRNGSWLTNAPTGATTFTDPNPPAGATYVIRNRPPGNNTFTDHSCVVV